MNSESLNTVVETFMINETINLVHDNDALTRWKEKVSELGLKGQEAIVEEGKSPIPFLWMNRALISTFETLCPTKIDIEDYDKTPIPVDLLEIVSLCVKENYFDKIKVWYNEKEKDPVIIGYVAKPGKTDEWDLNYYGQKYLIGRWADVKASIDQLVDRAKRLFLSSESIRIKKDIRFRQRELEDLESTVEEQFGGAMPATPLPF